ncbi:MAG: ECF transporter S component [Clostridia bacterium]|nr:ECF transporter S component [Clostridia bacterium]
MKKLSTRNFVLLALLVAVQIVLGYVNIPMPGGLHIVFNMIPMAIAAIAIGPFGGAVIGGTFGLISFLQCFGILGFSGMGAALAAINPFLSFVQRFFPRMIDGLLLGFIYRFLKPRTNVHVSCAVTGFFAAFLNTLLFMTSLVWLFGGTEYMQSSMAGRGLLTYIVASVGVNGLVEMLVSTLVTGLVGPALEKAGFFRD